MACGDLGVSRATFYRHGKSKEPFCGPRLPKTVPRALSPQERETVRGTLYSERFADHSVREVHATLLDEGSYLGSVRTIYRILEKDGATVERRDQLRHPSYAKPELLATGIHQVWSWDITMIRGPVKGQHFRLYVLLDIFSRYVVGWTLAWKESGQIARELIEETAIKEGIPEGKLTIHSDRGAPMTERGQVGSLSGSGRSPASVHRMVHLLDGSEKNFEDHLTFVKSDDEVTKVMRIEVIGHTGFSQPFGIDDLNSLVFCPARFITHDRPILEP